MKELTSEIYFLFCILAEQITVRIVQIMIQATDLAQILYGGHFSRKIRGPRKFFNMAAIFQDGRHGVS